MSQMSLYDFLEPDYKGSLDEILRLSAEHEIEKNIVLQECCGGMPKVLFISCHNYWVECPVCGRKTKHYDKAYKAMQAWNQGKGVMWDDERRRGCGRSAKYEH